MRIISELCSPYLRREKIIRGLGLLNLTTIMAITGIPVEDKILIALLQDITMIIVITGRKDIIEEVNPTKERT